MITKTIGPTMAPSQELTQMYAKSLMSPINWLIDYQLALTQAGKHIPHIVLANFSGSDWCSHCQDLDKEVFESATFLEWFNVRYLVPLLVDFPMKTPQAPETKLQNQKLLQQYNVIGYPSVLALRADGTEVGRLVGYLKGYGPTQWIQDLKAMAQIQ